MNNNYSKIIPLSLGVIILSIIVGSLVWAWQEPTIAPPGGNVEIRATSIATTTGTPVATDCDAAVERGRVRVNPATRRQYICTDIGWTFLEAAPMHHTLTVSVTNSGTVVSSPAGINCPGDCTESYLLGTSVSLTATPASGWSFTGWTGACSGTGACSVTMNTAHSVTATFTQHQTLSVTISGSGTVVSSPAGINCPGTCSANFHHGTSVSLTATPASGQTFLGWGGACSGTGGCHLSMTTHRSVTASFTQPPLILNNSSLNTSCATLCSQHGRICQSVGLDENASNGSAQWMNIEGDCVEAGGHWCGSTWCEDRTGCGHWTRCRCQ